jgi:hypothetical protein
MRAADIAEVRALTVHAKDDRARRFYQRFDFVESPTDPPLLFALIKDFETTLTKTGSGMTDYPLYCPSSRTSAHQHAWRVQEQHGFN